MAIRELAQRLTSASSRTRIGLLIIAVSSLVCVLAASALALEVNVVTNPTIVRPPAEYISHLDDQIPGVPFTRSPRTGAVSATEDSVDVVSVTLPGRQGMFRLTRVSGNAVYRFRVFGPTATSVTNSTPIATLTDGQLATHALFVAPTAATKYYVVVEAVSGSGTYRLWGPEPDDCLPGEPLPNPSDEVVDRVGEADAAHYAVDILSVKLNQDETYTFNASRKSGTGTFEFSVFGPDVKDVLSETPLKTMTVSSTKPLTFVPPATDKYYLLVRWTSGAGTYRIGLPGSAFGLDTYGYSFGNYLGYADMALFRDVFALGASPLPPMAQLYYDVIFRRMYGGGQCYGMAMTAGMFYRKAFGPAPATFKPGATTTRQLTRSTVGSNTLDLDEPLERHIGKYYYFQFDPIIQATQVKFLSVSDPATEIWSKLQQGWAQPYVLSFWGTRADGSIWGHATNITGMRSAFSWSTAAFSVYDNNRPDNYRPWNLTNGLVTSPDYEGIYTACVTPVTANEKTSLLPIWLLPNSWAVSTCSASDAELLHTDSAGRRLGQVNGAEVEEMPEGYRVIPLTGEINPNFKPPVLYYLRKVGDVGVALSRPVAGSLKYDLFFGDMLAEMDLPNAAPGVVSRLRTDISARGFGYSSEASAAVPVTLRLFRQTSATKSRVYAFSGLSVPSSMVVTISAPGSGDGGALRVRGATQPLPYSLKLTAFNGARTSSTVITCSVSPSTESSETSQAIVIWDWNRLGTAPVFAISKLPGGRESVVAFQAKGMSSAAFLQEMVARRLVTSRTLSGRIQSRLGTSSASLGTYLSGLVDQRSLSPRAAGLLYAYSLANRTARGRLITPVTLSFRLSSQSQEMRARASR
jgi:hypothetical protein